MHSLLQVRAGRLCKSTVQCARYALLLLDLATLLTSCKARPAATQDLPLCSASVALWQFGCLTISYKGANRSLRMKHTLTSFYDMSPP